MKNRIVNALREFTKKISDSLERLTRKFDLSRLVVTKWERQGTYLASNNQICMANLNLIERDPYDYAQYVN